MDILKLFEFKPDPWQFLNSPLFFLIVAIIAISYFVIVIALRWRRKKRKQAQANGEEKPKKKLRFKRDVADKEPKKAEQQPEESSPEEPQKTFRHNLSKPKEETTGNITMDELKKQVTEEQYKECEHIVYMAKSMGSSQQIDIGTLHITVLPTGFMTYFKSEPEQIDAIREELYHIVKTVVTETLGSKEKREEFAIEGQEVKRRFVSASEYKPHVETIRIPPKEQESKIAEHGVDLIPKEKISSRELELIERWVDSLDEEKLDELDAKLDSALDKKKRKIINKIGVLMAMQNGEETQNKTEQPPVNDKPVVETPELTQRQIIFSMCDRGLSETQIVDATKYEKRYVKQTVAEWKKREKKKYDEAMGEPITQEPVPSETEQKKMAEPLIVRPNQEFINKVIAHIEKGDKIVIEDGKVYYAGRDKLTYLFMATTLIFLILFIVKLL